MLRSRGRRPMVHPNPPSRPWIVAEGPATAWVRCGARLGTRRQDPASPIHLAAAMTTGSAAPGHLASIGGPASEPRQTPSALDASANRPDRVVDEDTDT